jgi:hypothetical protein
MFDEEGTRYLDCINNVATGESDCPEIFFKIRFRFHLRNLFFAIPVLCFNLFRPNFQFYLYLSSSVFVCARNTKK